MDFHFQLESPYVVSYLFFAGAEVTWLISNRSPVAVWRANGFSFSDGVSLRRLLRREGRKNENEKPRSSFPERGLNFYQSGLTSAATLTCADDGTRPEPNHPNHPRPAVLSNFRWKNARYRLVALFAINVKILAIQSVNDGCVLKFRHAHQTRIRQIHSIVLVFGEQPG